MPLRYGDFEVTRREDGSLWELGRGAMGVTYKAVDTVLHRAVALKVIQFKLGDAAAGQTSALLQERFLREARAAAALRHAHVAAVFQFGASNQTEGCYYAMELVEGETLDARVRRDGPLSAGAALEVARQVSAALVAAADCGLIHRDLKPSNLMLAGGHPSADGLEVKVIDFGLAKAAAVAGESDLTHGGFVGTPAYASPEQFARAVVDTRSDLYSLGVTLWYALAGKAPFTGRSLEEWRDDPARAQLPVAQLTARKVPACVVALLRRVLAVDPAARPASARELLRAIDACHQTLGVAGSPRAARRPVPVIALALLAVTGGAWWLFSTSSVHRGVAPPLPDKSVAVLPFDHFSKDEDSAVFADGVQEEVLANLVKVADLKVISRTSVLPYQKEANRNLREIGKALGVAYVVEGSVQRAGNKIRVTATLIDARTDAHRWAEHYDRDLSDVFAIQSEIAVAIADQLQAKISPREKAAIKRPPTSNVAAYDLYVRATALIDTATLNRTLKENLLQAIYLLDEAVGRDPAFLLAYCKLAYAHDLFYRTGSDHTATRLSLAEAAARSALRVQPDSGDAHLALAYHFYSQLEYDRALAEIATARFTLPNDPRTFMLSAYINRQQGRWVEAATNTERALESDPRNLAPLDLLAGIYELLRDYPAEVATLNRILAIQPTNFDARLGRARVEISWHADPRPLHMFKDALLRDDPAARVRLAPMWVYLALCERDSVAAERATVDMGENSFGPTAVQFSRTFTEGLIARMKGDTAAAQTAFGAARVAQERIVSVQPDYAPALCVLGMIDAALGHKEDALREGRHAEELLPATKDSVNGLSVAEFLVAIYAWTGEKDLAVERLRTVSLQPGLGGYGQLKLLPFWDPLRGDPRFEAVVASLAPKP